MSDRVYRRKNPVIFIQRAGNEAEKVDFVNIMGKATFDRCRGDIQDARLNEDIASWSCRRIAYAKVL